MRSALRTIATLIASIGLSTAAFADEGMWLLNKLPVDHLEQTYGFKPDAAWVELVQKACVRASSGGSGSFISPSGLMMTNHHVGSTAIADVSDATHDYIRDGFYAARHTDEIKCPNLKLFQLLSIKDLTAKVNSGVTENMSSADARKAREKAITEIQEKAKTGEHLMPEMVKLYHGARYHLYLYKVFDDVRLVMAPEHGIVFDGNIHSLVWDVEFDQQQARSVSVHSRAIIEGSRRSTALIES